MKESHVFLLRAYRLELHRFVQGTDAAETKERRRTGALPGVVFTLRAG